VRLRWILGLTIVVGVSAPWYALMLSRHGAAFVNGHLLKENLLLFSREQYAGQPPWWFYLQILAVGLLPWTGVALGRLFDDLRARWQGRRIDAFETLLWVWVVSVVGFFSLSQFKLDHYVFPAAPALCLLCARAWADLAESDRAGAGIRVGARAVGPVLVLSGLVIAFLVVTQFDLPAAVWVLPAALVIGGAAIAATIQRRASAAAPWIGAATMGVLFFGRWVGATAAEHDRIAMYRLNRWSAAFRFYVGRHTVVLNGPDVAADFFASAPHFYVAMLEPAYQEFVSRGVPLRVVYEREGMWATTGRALWREKEAPTRFVVVTRRSPH
jgi:hypothetical protein